MDFLGLFYHKEVILFFKFVTAVKWPLKKTTYEPINVDLSKAFPVFGQF